MSAYLADNSSQVDKEKVVLIFIIRTNVLKPKVTN